MTLVDADTGEVVQEFTETEAREHTERINAAVAETGNLVVEAWERRIWKPLGYSSWEDYCAAEVRYSPNAESRAVLMVGLRTAGANYRAIGAAVGVNERTARRHLAGAANAAPERVTGSDGKSYPASRPKPTVSEDLADDLEVGEAEAIADELLDAGIDPTPEAVAEAAADAVESKDVPEPPITKPDLGGGISHPARFSDAILTRFALLLGDEPLWVLDPFAGTGRIHELDHHTVGVEIEPEWADLHENTVLGSALDLPWEDGEFHAIATSPTYGNRLADSHNASDPERRRSYTHDLGRPLAEDNSGDLQWGERYRLFHQQAWAEAVRVLVPGGLFLLNIKDHVRDGVQQPVAAWHVATLTRLGLLFDAVRSGGVPTRHLRQGTTSERAGQELVLVFVKDES